MSSNQVFVDALQVEIDRLMRLRRETEKATREAAEVMRTLEPGSPEMIEEKMIWNRSIEEYMDVQGELGVLNGIARHFGVTAS